VGWIVRELDAPSTWNLGVVGETGRVLATSSLHPVPCPLRPDAALLWTNARDAALPFYRRFGFDTVAGSGFGPEGRPTCAMIARGSWGLGQSQLVSQARTGVRLGSVIKKRRKKMRKHKHRKMLKKTRWARRAHS
jgi:mRNA-processing protein COX24